MKDKQMILAFDTYYFEDKAKTVMVAFNEWTDSTTTSIMEEVIGDVAAYEPGSFYKREMPCILSLLNQVELHNIHTIIVDGFVVLDDTGKSGLGGHLFDKLNGEIPIIGVAKSSFHNNKKFVRELCRGESKKPLYITAKGIDLDAAYQNIKSMHGEYRMPTLLQILDAKTKEIKMN